MAWFAGIDGCRAGWIVVLASDQDDVSHQLVLCPRFDDILNLKPRPKTIVIDIPIGLLDERVAGGRPCERETRSLLGWPRRNSVFSAPPRAVLSARSYDEARPHGLTRQAFGILPKVREADATMTPALQRRVYESHPELALLSIAGRPMRHRKKSKQGREERLDALREAARGFNFLGNIDQAFEADGKAYLRKQVALDDIVDAYVMAWVTLRIAEGNAHRVPDVPPVDGRGLRMEIWY